MRIMQGIYNKSVIRVFTECDSFNSIIPASL